MKGVHLSYPTGLDVINGGNENRCHYCALDQLDHLEWRGSVDRWCIWLGFQLVHHPRNSMKGVQELPPTTSSGRADGLSFCWLQRSDTRSCSRLFQWRVWGHGSFVSIYDQYSPSTIFMIVPLLHRSLRVLVSPWYWFEFRYNNGCIFNPRIVIRSFKIVWSIARWHNSLRSSKVCDCFNNSSTRLFYHGQRGRDRNVTNIFS